MSIASQAERGARDVRDCGHVADLREALAVAVSALLAAEEQLALRPPRKTAAISATAELASAREQLRRLRALSPAVRDVLDEGGWE